MDPMGFGLCLSPLCVSFSTQGRTLPLIHSTLDLLHVAEVPVPVPVPVPAPAPVAVAPVAPRPIERPAVPVIRHVAPPVVAAPVSWKAGKGWVVLVGVLPKKVANPRHEEIHY